MHKVVITDTSTLILFQKINALDLLGKVYSDVCTTPEVEKEFGAKLPAYIKIQSVKDKKYQALLETQVDIGEASAIALASEYDDALLVIDDLKARKLAGKLKFRITGTLGVINKAKQMSIIPHVKPLINKLLETDFRIADAIIEEFLRLNDE